MESSLYTEDLEVNHLLFHFINLANENNDCISCILVHLISFMFIAIYLAFHRIRVAFPRKFIGKSVTGIGKTVLQIKNITKLLDKKFVFIILLLANLFFSSSQIFLIVYIHTSDNKCRISKLRISYNAYHFIF